jgi:hypothetical protein
MRLLIGFSKYCILLFSVFIIAGCNTKPDKKNECPSFSLVLQSPYEDPLPHPSGLSIGFNHTPLIEIRYNYGYDCPLQASYIFDINNSGFWMIDSDGNNKRKVLPYYLVTPSWSPDGSWITFSRDGCIYKMYFDGEQFDTISPIQLTFGTNDFYPAWRSDGEYIAYDNSDCGSIGVDPPPNSCGILIKDSNIGNETTFIIKERRFPYWGLSKDTLFYGLFSYNLLTKTEETILDLEGINFRLAGRPLYNLNNGLIFFKGKFLNSTDNICLYSIKPSGQDFTRVSDDPILDFSIAPSGEIIYVLYNGYRLDEGNGALWIMDSDGSNKRQLTFDEVNILIE